MEDIISSIVNGCKLAKELESSLPNIADRPDIISRLCDEIIKRFLAARERLNAHQAAPAPSALFNYPVAAAATGEMVLQQQQQQQQQIDVNLQEWLRSSMTQAMDIIQTHVLGDHHQRNPFDQVHPMDVSDSSKASSSSSQPRHRRSENARTVRVPAPQIGNTEIPPEDGYTWRKYGQKEILNSKYPRSYYRCTHQKLYHCLAKKQVQRLDDDPFTFEIVYHGDHTCHMSSTAPSAPPTSLEMTQEMTTHSVTMQQPSSTSNLGGWLTMDVGTGGASGSGAGPSTVRYEREAAGVSAGAGDQYLVANMADAMFNSGSSSSNSMEFLFPSSNIEDKWYLEDKKDHEP